MDFIALKKNLPTQDKNCQMCQNLILKQYVDKMGFRIHTS